MCILKTQISHTHNPYLMNQTNEHLRKNTDTFILMTELENPFTATKALVEKTKRYLCFHLNFTKDSCGFFIFFPLNDRDRLLLQRIKGFYRLKPAMTTKKKKKERFRHRLDARERKVLEHWCVSMTVCEMPDHFSIKIKE